MTKKQRRVKKAIEYLEKYIATYNRQYGYLDYQDETIIDDMLYGLGVALHGDKAKWEEGFNWFKGELMGYLWHSGVSYKEPEAEKAGITD